MKALTNAQIKKSAPAAIAVSADEARTSSKYGFIPTTEAIAFLQNEGYHVTAASQMWARKKDNRFTRHLVSMTHDDNMKDDEKGAESIPQILLLNSHNGTTALRLQTGFFRFVCANGLIVGESTSEQRLRHSMSIRDALEEQLAHAVRTTRESVEVIDAWKKRKLTKAKMETFAQKAAELRVRGGASASFYEPRSILAPKRDEDDSNTLWAVFNRVQENLVKGGIEGQRESGRIVTLRPLTNIRKNTEFNRNLWLLARDFAA